MLLATTMPALASEPKVNIIPWPQSLTVTGGHMRLDDSSRIVYSALSLADLAAVVAGEVEEISRLTLNTSSGDPKAGDIYLTYTTDPTITGERHKVSVASHATAEAENYNAVAMASATLIQSIRRAGSTVIIPKMNVLDEPDAGYRGLMVDVARQYHSIDTLKDVVTMCRLYKIRYLQLHLSDDQAFTFPSARYPALAAYGNDYSMSEMRDLVAFADQRGVILIPEIDVPAHATCFTNSMPDLFASPTNGIINFADSAVWEAMGIIINEVCDVFDSSPYIHLGADEANIWGLPKDPEFKAAIAKYGVGGIEGLFNRFITHLNDTIKARGKKTVVWEGFNCNLKGNARMNTDVAVMMFDNYKKPQDYLSKGHKVINASWFPLYVVGSAGFGAKPMHIYDWQRYKFGNYTDPFPRRYDSVYWKNTEPTPYIPGAQMCSWEMPGINEIPYLRNRLAPFADRIWNPTNANGFEHFKRRFGSADIVLDSVLAAHHPPDAPLNVAASSELYPDKIRVAWAASANYPIRYAVYRNSADSPSTATLIDDDIAKSVTEYVDTDIAIGRTYYYWVKAWNKWGWSSFSEKASGRTGRVSDHALAYEPFDYSPNSDIDGQGSGFGFSSAWNLKAKNGPTVVTSTGLTYPGLPVTGKALRFEFMADNPSTELHRELFGRVGRDMSIVWFSFLIQVETVGDGHCYILLNDAFEGVAVGKKWGNGFGFHRHHSVKLENGRTYFAVARYDCRRGNDIAHLWVNPSLSQEPQVESADCYYAGGDIGLGSSVSFSIQGYGRGRYVYDEIRIGSTWKDVTAYNGGNAPLSNDNITMCGTVAGQ